MKKIEILLFLLITSVFFSCTPNKSKTEIKKPNIVYILADDLGYGDISALNNESKIKTPAIDKLASEGMVFTDAHSNSSVCTPTRYGILTGQYCWRSRIKKGVLLGYSPSLIEDSTPTVAKYLKEKGYTTACIGKWHLGIDFKLKDGKYHEAWEGIEFTDELKGFNDYESIDFSQHAKGGPFGAGFEYSYVLPASLDFEPYMYLENNLTVEAPTAHTPGNALDADPWATGAFWRQGQMAPSFSFEEVLPTFRKKAIEFIDKQKDSEKPFFLYFPMNAPHTPWVPKDAFKGSSDVGEYGDFVQMVDFEVGQILTCLDENGFTENTLVIFTSDNGAYWRPELIEQFNHNSNYTFRGMKGDIWEGGHHIPFIAKWPGKIEAGTKTSQLTSLTDFFATVQSLFEGEDNKPLDSYSILPVLTGKKEKVERAPVIHHSGSGKFAIRDNHWKYIEGLGSGGFTDPKFPEPKPGEPDGQLYNLTNDLQEQENLYFEFPEKVDELKKKLSEIRGY